MTFLPAPSRQVEGAPGPQIAPGYTCAMPACLLRAQERHHLWRRSALGGAYDWVLVNEDALVRNVADLCRKHHQDITENRAWIRLIDNQLVWCTLDLQDNWIAVAPLTFDVNTDVICEHCGQAKKRPKLGGDQAKKRRSKTLSISVPDDKEDGAAVLDTLVESICDDLGYQGTKGLARYHALTAAAVFTLQHREMFLKERA
jgi:hypothetical protein